MANMRVDPRAALSSQQGARHQRHSTFMDGTEPFFGPSLPSRGGHPADALANTVIVGDARYHTGFNSKMDARNRRGKSFMSSLQNAKMTGINLVGSADGKAVFTPLLASDFMTNASSGGGHRGPTSGATGQARKRLGTSGLK